MLDVVLSYASRLSDTGRVLWCSFLVPYSAHGDSPLTQWCWTEPADRQMYT